MYMSSRHQIDVCSSVDICMHVHSMSVIRFKFYLHKMFDSLEFAAFGLASAGDWFYGHEPCSYAQSHHQMACPLHWHHGMIHLTSEGSLPNCHVPGLTGCMLLFLIFEETQFWEMSSFWANFALVLTGWASEAFLVSIITTLSAIIWFKLLFVFVIFIDHFHHYHSIVNDSFCWAVEIAAVDWTVNICSC